MIRVFRVGFYPRFFFLFVPLFLESSGFCGDWSRSVESKVAELQQILTQCAQRDGLCADSSKPERQWLEIRWQGATRLIRPFDSSQRLDPRLASTPFPKPVTSGDTRVWVLGVAQGWDRPRILFEKATALNRSVAFLTELSPEFQTIENRDSTKRMWLLSSDGEVLFQSEGNFIGSVLKDSDHFANPQSRVSFDQLQVTPEWTSLQSLQWWALEESIHESPPAAPFHERLWRWFSNWGVSLFKAVFLCSILVLVLSVGYVLRALFRWIVGRLSKHPDNESAEITPSSVEVSVPHVVQALRAPSSERVSARVADEKRNWMHSVLKSRNFLEMGRRLMVILAEESDSPVLFLEFHRDSSMAIFRDQVGIQAHRVPVSMRIPVSDLSGRFHEQPAFQNVLLNRLGVSHFEVLELRAPQGSGLRPQLLGLFVLLAPGVKSFENKSHFERLLAQAGRYHDAILRPAPPQLRQ